MACSSLGLASVPAPPALVEVGKFGMEGEIERLKRDKNVLMLELVRLRQQQQQQNTKMQVGGPRRGLCLVFTMGRIECKGPTVSARGTVSLQQAETQFLGLIQ